MSQWLFPTKLLPEYKCLCANNDVLCKISSRECDNIQISKKKLLITFELLSRESRSHFRLIPLNLFICQSGSRPVWNLTTGFFFSPSSPPEFVPSVQILFGFVKSANEGISQQGCSWHPDFYTYLATNGVPKDWSSFATPTGSWKQEVRSYLSTSLMFCLQI